MRLIVLPGVFRPISDSRLLADAVREHVRPGTAMLDVCTGSGLLAVTAAMAGASATAVDVSRRAVACARINGLLNGVTVRARRGSLFEQLDGERFDLIASNPPYVPDSAPPAGRGLERAWHGGLDGRELLDRLIAQAPDHLHPGGCLLITQSTVIGEEETLGRMRAAGMAPEVLVRRPGPLGPLMRDRRGHLEAQGLLAPGQETEEVLIVMARLPVAETKRFRPARAVASGV